MELTTVFSEFARAAGPAAMTALWQGAVLAIGLTICMRIVPRVSAADRFRAWAAGFAALLALPFLPLMNAIHFGVQAAGAATAVAPASRAWFVLDPRWAVAIAGLWLAASMWRAADLAVHGLRLRKIWKSAEPIERMNADFEVCSTRELDRPSVIGFLKPRILIPAWLLDRLSAAELEQVILHEAEHLRRRDDWTNLLQKLALVVFPLNPGLAWVEGRLCHEREMACDDAVVRATGKPRAYAACLASLAERGLERRREALQLGAWRKRPELVGRVHRLLKYAPGLNPVAARALLAVVGSGLVFGSVEFARAPQLVAFVAPVIAQSNMPDVVNADRGGRAVAGFHAVNAVAQMPDSSDLSRTTKDRASERLHASHPTAIEKSADLSGRRNVGDENVSSSISATQFIETATADDVPANGQQWVVLTAWEQVVSAHRNTGVVADYDVDATTPAQSAEQAAIGAATGAAKAAARPAVGQWTVIQLVMHVDASHADAGRGQAGADGGTRDSDFQTNQPTAIPLRDGWLILQL